MNKALKRKWRQWRFFLRRHVFALYALIKHRMRVWQLLNRQASKNFAQHLPQLDDQQTNLVQELKDKGIAVTSLDALFPNENRLEDLLAYVEKRQDRARLNHKKPFLEDLLPEIPELGVEIPFFNLATDERILAVVNSYMGMHSMLHHFMLRRSLPAHGRLPSHSQNWHRAPQEKRNCRVYIYLTEVTENDGPFCYVPQSTINKQYAHVAPQTALKGGYVTAEKVESKVPESERLSVTGPAGTVIFCDTTGLHRGGYSQNSSRLMSTFGYGAPTLRENIHYSYPTSLLAQLKQQSPAAAMVLNPRWQR